MKRERITITIRDDILKKVDETIDHAHIRTRSHAIEYLLLQMLRSTINTALILAGGKGMKLKPLTEELPKTLLPVKGKPILEYQIEQLRNAEIRNIFILIGHLGEKIKYYFGDGSKFGVRIHYIEQEPKEIGTGYALYHAKPFLSEAPFLLLYGDVLAEINIKDFIDHHIAAHTIASIALTTLKYPSIYGVAKIRGEKIVEFLEKPKEKEELSRVVNGGMFCFEPEIFNYLSSTADLALERDIFPNLARQEKLHGYLFEGQWFDIGTQDVYERAIKEWNK